jgi:hypothetical protein
MQTTSEGRTGDIDQLLASRVPKPESLYWTQSPLSVPPVAIRWLCSALSWLNDAIRGRWHREGFACTVERDHSFVPRCPSARTGTWSAVRTSNELSRKISSFQAEGMLKPACRTALAEPTIVPVGSFRTGRRNRPSLDRTDPCMSRSAGRP